MCIDRLEAWTAVYRGLNLGVAVFQKRRFWPTVNSLIFRLNLSKSSTTEKSDETARCFAVFFLENVLGSKLYKLSLYYGARGFESTLA